VCGVLSNVSKIYQDYGPVIQKQKSMVEISINDLNNFGRFTQLQDRCDCIQYKISFKYSNHSNVI